MLRLSSSLLVRRALQAQFRAAYSADGGKRPSFFGNFIQNLKEEYSQDKKIQANLEKFRQEAKKLEDSEALKEARRKFENIESETSKNTGALKEQLSSLAEKVKDLEATRRATELKETVAKTAETAGKVLGEAAETIGKSPAFKTAASTASVIKEEIEGHALGTRVYKRPKNLRKRKETSKLDGEAIEVNTEATGVELHKDSKFYASWQKFKDSNPLVNKIIEARMKYEESDNAIVRGARVLTDKLQDLVGGMFTRTELSQALTEIIKTDPNFCREQFLKDCERDIIPNILEAMIQGDLEILEDWCYEAPFNILAQPIRQARELGYTIEASILDIDQVDLATGMMMEQGPVLAITFNAQQIMCVRDKSGNVVEGDPDKVMRIMYIFVLCRDQTEMDPKAAWKLLEVQARDRQEQYL